MKQVPRADPELLKLASAEWHHERFSIITAGQAGGMGLKSDSRLLSAVGCQSAGRLLQMTMHWRLPSCTACSCCWLLTVGLGWQTLALRHALGRLLRKQKLSGQSLGAGFLQKQEVGVSMLHTSEGMGAPDDALCIP